MQSVLDRNVFLVKEQVGAFRASSSYDIFDAETGEQVLECREPNLGVFTKIFRFTDYKTMAPFDVHVREPGGGATVVRVKRGVAFLKSRVQVLDEADEPIGSFRQKIFSIGGAFTVVDAAGNDLCKLKGKWTGWDFRFLSVDGDTEYAHVTKKWAGIGKELFTSADNYVLEIYETVAAGHPMRLLILAAVMCIDFVLKE